MTDIEISGEYWADKFHKVLLKGRVPEVDEFDTDFIDEEIAKWEQEDEAAEELQQLMDDPDEWELVKD